MTKVPNSANSALGGNTKPPKQETEKKKQSNPKANWCLTLNNWTPDEHKILLDYIKGDSANEYIIGKEKLNKEGELGTPHLQIWFSFNIKKRWETLKKINNRLHVEETKGSKKQNLAYCSKEGDFVTNCRVPRPLEVIQDLRTYQRKIMDIVETEPEPRKIYWFWGDKNIGKTEILFKLCAEKQAFILPTSKRHALSQVFKTHEDTDIYCMNLTADESEYQSNDMFSILESIKDRMFAAAFGTECNGMCLMNHKHLIVLGNQPPDFMKTEIDQNRFIVEEIEKDWE